MRFFSFFLFLIMLSTTIVSGAEPLHIYLGTYTGPGEADAKGIYLTELDPADGSLTAPRLVAECARPAFLAKHPYKPLLYAIGELSSHAAVYAFAIDEKSGDLTKLNEETVPGKGACHLCVCCFPHDLENYKVAASVAVACYGDGSVSMLPTAQDGKLEKCTAMVRFLGSGPNKSRQTSPHAHAVYWSPLPTPFSRNPGILFALDLGRDKMLAFFSNTEEGDLSRMKNFEVDLPPGCGPRHLAMSVHYFYILNELDSTICTFQLNNQPKQNDEKLGKIVQTLSTLPEGVKAADCDNTTAEIFIHPNGKFLYASNRGHDSIALFTISPEDGKLTFVATFPSGGKHPRSFDLSPDGNWLISANMNTNNVTTFRIDPENGKLTPTGKEITLGKPVCVLPVRK